LAELAPGVVHDGRRFGEDHSAAYRLLGRLEPGLCLDVGAAIGRMTEIMLASCPGSRIVAYEPFPGNLRLLTKAYCDRADVTLRPVAAADRAGKEVFSVSGIVGRNAPDWARSTLGYSPLGHLGKSSKAAATMQVETVRLDDEIREHVRFLKIDVQGSELRVLKGATGLIDAFGIDLIYVEFNGSLEILKFLGARNYVVFDCAYVAWPIRRHFRNWFRRPSARVLPGWPSVGVAQRAMGADAAMVWPRVPARAFALYCAWFFLTRLLRCGLQTDLLCVHRDVLDKVLAA